MVKTTEEKEIELGKEIVELFSLKRAKGSSKKDFEVKFDTSYGTKTYLGLGRTIKRLVDEHRD